MRSFSAPFYLLVASTLALGAGCHAKTDKAAGKGGDKKNAGPALVDVLVARPSASGDSVVANGAVVANDYVELHPEVSGRLTFLNVREGQRVAKGTVVARINDADLQAQLAKTNALLKVSHLSQQRLEKLLSMQGVNQADYDLAVSQVQSNEADASYTRALLAKTIIRAPFSGIVGLRQVSPGAYVTPTTIITTVRAADKLKVDFTLPEANAALVQPGHQVTVRLGSSRYPATVQALESQVNQTTRNLTVRALLPAGVLATPGTFARVSVSTGAARQRVQLPTSAIVPGDQADQVVLVKGGKAKMQNVQTGDRQSDSIAITSGLALGDSVVTNGVLFTQPGKPVKVRKALVKN
ncbi:MAG: efflux RND transporter periplasmic adaptor subunit [Janthinobacterium lividum]